MPADALWTFAMACNVYLTFFHKYDSEQLRRLEWKYVLYCYGIPFVPAFAYFFIQTQARGRIYGSAIVSKAPRPSFYQLMLIQSPPPTALVLDLCTVVFPPHRHLLRTSLAHYLGYLRHLPTCRVGDLPETAPASEPRRHRLRSCPRISLCYVDWHPSYQGDCLFYSGASVLVRERRTRAAV